MAKKRRQFRRATGGRSYRKLFVIAVEGTKTEPQYFGLLNSQNAVIKVECLKDRTQSSPLQVLKRMKARLRREAIKPSDEAWLVVDKDQWTDVQLNELHQWSESRDNYGFALSNPKFEYWLLLHFEEGTGIASPRECTERLKTYLGDYDKGIDGRTITREQILDAIRRARVRDKQRSDPWPRSPGGTTVYRLVEKLI